MSYRVGIKKLTELVSTTDIKQLYKASSVSVSPGVAVNTWIDEGVFAENLKNPSINAPVLGVDALGYRYLDFNSITSKLQTDNSISINADDTIIVVAKVNTFVGSGNKRASFRRQSNYNQFYITDSLVASEATNYGDGTGANYFTPLNYAPFEKCIYVAQRRTTISPLQTSWYNLQKRTVPMTNITLPAADINVVAGVNSTFSLYYYLVINKYVDENTLRQLIRSIAFEHGVKI